MNKNLSKSQEEVWCWKQKAYESVQHLPLNEQIQNIILRTEEIHKSILEKQSINLKNNHGDRN